MRSTRILAGVTLIAFLLPTVVRADEPIYPPVAQPATSPPPTEEPPAPPPPGFAPAPYQPPPPAPYQAPTPTVARPVEPVPSAEEIEALRSSGNVRRGVGTALLVVGIVGYVASFVGTLLGVPTWIADQIHDPNRSGIDPSTGKQYTLCNADCRKVNDASNYFSWPGLAAEVVGLGIGIPLLSSGISRQRRANKLQARHVSITLAPAATGSGATAGLSFAF